MIKRIKKKKQNYAKLFNIQIFTHLNKLGVVQPFESMPSPFYCREFLHAVHHHRPLFMEIERENEKQKIHDTEIFYR